MDEALRWTGFGAGVVVSIGTVIGVMKALIVPRRSWSLLPALIGRYGYRFFLAVAVRLRSYDLADRWLGFLAPTVVIGILASFLASFVLGFALLLLPFGDLTFGDALLESGSSVFTLGFLASSEKPPLALDVVAAATGMIFVALTIGYLPSLYAEVKAREALVKQLEGWTGVPSWGPEILARLSLAGAVDRLPELYSAWDSWSARVADTHMKYPVLTHFRLPLARNHRLVSLLAVLDAAALDSALRPASTPASARLLIAQGSSCLQAVAYPMRRVAQDADGARIGREEFRAGSSVWSRPASLPRGRPTKLGPISGLCGPVTRPSPTSSFTGRSPRLHHGAATGPDSRTSSTPPTLPTPGRSVEPTSPDVGPTPRRFRWQNPRRGRPEIRIHAHGPADLAHQGDADGPHGRSAHATVPARRGSRRNRAAGRHRRGADLGQRAGR